MIYPCVFSIHCTVAEIIRTIRERAFRSKTGMNKFRVLIDASACIGIMYSYYPRKGCIQSCVTSKFTKRGNIS